MFRLRQVDSRQGFTVAMADIVDRPKRWTENDAACRVSLVEVIGRHRLDNSLAQSRHILAGKTMRSELDP